MNDFENVDPDVLRRLLIEARNEIDALKAELVRERSTTQAALARLMRVSPAHPSVQDPCPARGTVRPRLVGIKGGAA